MEVCQGEVSNAWQIGNRYMEVCQGEVSNGG